MFFIFRGLAMDHPDLYWSIITDGMAQVHCELPYLGNQCQFGQTWTQHLQGVLEHGYGVHFFRTFENVKDTANIGMYSLLSVIEQKIIRDGRLPDTVFIQIDGGKIFNNLFIDYC